MNVGSALDIYTNKMGLGCVIRNNEDLRHFSLCMNANEPRPAAAYWPPLTEEPMERGTKKTKRALEVTETTSIEAMEMDFGVRGTQTTVNGNIGAKSTQDANGATKQGISYKDKVSGTSDFDTAWNEFQAELALASDDEEENEDENNWKVMNIGVVI